jgi:outer membrane immunogenic protein
MKKLALALSAVAAFTGSAIAADLPARPYVKAAPVAYVPAPSWTGCYVAGGGGYGMWNQENTTYERSNTEGVSNLSGIREQVSGTQTNGGRGWFGTVQGGCDYQFAAAGQQFVIGADAAYDFSNLKGNVNGSFEGASASGNYFGEEKQTSAWSVGGRIGWVIFPQLLTYFSGGYTQSHFNAADFAFFGCGSCGSDTIGSRTYKGWYLGGGDEYALSFMPGLFWKTEYRLAEYKKATNQIFLDSGTEMCGCSLDSKKWVQTVRSELVYRFNWGGPVVAKY